ncbi:MAG: LURP-one-related family protein, partial [Bdellovibrionales bacterium]|nr:LURP-one-related family protein [Bdellovibrionales bacterium]
HLISVGSDFSVRDENGVDVYLFDGKVFSVGTKIIIFDRKKEEVGRLRRKFFTLAPTFNLYSGKRVVATISKKLFTFRPAFTIRGRDGEPIQVTGRFLEHDYRFTRERKEVAVVSKKWFREADTYGVEVKHRSDALLVLCGVVIIDLLCHPKRDSSFR